MTVGTSMKKISSLALLVRQLRCDQLTNNRPYEIGLINFNHLNNIGIWNVFLLFVELKLCLLQLKFE